MAVRFDLGGRAILNATQYSVQEDSTPINPADESGGTSQIDFVAPEWAGWKASEDLELNLSDDTQGETQGFVAAVSNSNGIVSVSADSRLQQLATKRTAQPYQGSLGGAIRYYLSLVGIIDGMVIEDALNSIPVVFPGWEDDVYQRVARGICPAFGVELSLVSNNVVIRFPRQRKALLTRLLDQGIQESVSGDSRAQRTKLNWAKTTWVTDKLVYPTGGWTPDVEILDVNAGEVKVYENVEIGASLQSIQQPVCVLNIGPGHDSSSVYTVAGTDGLPIPPAMWAAYGGSLKVEVNPDTRSLKVTIRGMDFQEYGPYQIAVSSGDGTSYSTLRLLGTGVLLDPQVVDIGTGLDPDRAPDEYGAEVTNDFIIDNDQAYSAASWQAAAATGPARTISFTAAGINRASDTGSAVYATVQDWDEEFAGLNTDQWDALWAGKSDDEWNAFWASKVGSSFANQAFGNMAGSRVVHSDGFFRIRSVTNTGGLVQASGEADNTVDDFDTFFDGMTTDDWDAYWGPDVTNKEFDVAPFPNLNFDGTRPRKYSGTDTRTYPGDNTYPSTNLYPSAS